MGMEGKRRKSMKGGSAVDGVVNEYSVICFFFNDPATTGIYTLSLHDALPIWRYRNENRAV